MAKGPSRGNREAKKPKSAKNPTVVASSILSPKNIAVQKALPQKKS